MTTQLLTMHNRIPKKYWFRIIGLIMVYFVSCSKSGGGSTGGGTTTTTPPVTTPPVTTSSDVSLWLTRADKTTLLQKQTAVMNFTTTTNQNPTITVDTTQTYQSIDGFGFALTGGSAYLINRLAATDRAALVKELFGTDSTGIGISYIRVSLGASDLSNNVFTYDDIPAGQTDTTLQYFSLDPEKYDLIPLLQQILTVNPNIKILACPWTAPLWMKTANNSIGGSLQHQYYSTYAQYFVKYIQGMQAQGIPIEAVTPQNEPLNPYNNPSMQMLATEQADFVGNYLGPAFAAANLTTKIIAWDHNCDNTSYPLTVLGDAKANKYTAGAAFHLYSGDISALSQVHNAFPDKNVYFTEQWLQGPSTFNTDLNWHMKNLIIGATRNWSKNVIEWNLASDPNYQPHTVGGCTTCLGAITVGNTITRNTNYYAIAHAAKFVRPGSVRVLTNITYNLQNVAFETPDGKKVLIVLNDNTKAETFNIAFNGKQVSATLDAGAVGTFVW